MNAGKTAVAIGNFDGVHKGHQVLLADLTKQAEAHKLTPVVYTFQEHPINIIRGNGTVKYLTDREEKTSLLKQYGIQDVHYADFECVKELSPASFVKEILVDKLHISMAFMGENNRFGKNAQGDAETLKQLGEQFGFSVCVIPSHEENGVVCSSSYIRELLVKGRVFDAQQFLGRPYLITGSVISGKHLGRSYGFPTANMLMPTARVTPAYGVYATTAYVGEKGYPAITNVGCTSFDKERVERIETHIIGFDDDLYGKSLSVAFLWRMRDFVPYESVDALAKQLLSDKEERMKKMEETI